MPTNNPLRTANRNHLDHSNQDSALSYREAGATYPQVAAAYNFNNADAAMYACEMAATRRDGNRFAVRRYTRRTTSRPAAVQHTGRTTQQVTSYSPSASTDAADMLFLNRNFGIELEYNRGTITGNPVQAACDAFRAAGLQARVESYNHATPSQWKMTTDATVTGGEAVSPILNGADGWEQFRKAMEALKGIGAAVGANVGCHVHHDVNDLDQDAMRRLATNLSYIEDAMLAYVPAHRYNGSNGCGAQKYTATEWRSIQDAIANGTLVAANRNGARSGWIGVGRYKSFNFNSVLSYGTVEFRAHGGCLTPFMMRCWIAVGQAIVQFSKDGNLFDGVQTTQQMLDTLVGSGHLRREMRSRFIKRCEQIAA